MKGLTIKKLAAVAVGGALIGSALAPVVSAAVTTNIDTLQESDVVNATGEPVVNVVAGSMGAAASDLVWAGNIAAKVAQLATVDKTVAISGGGDDSTADPTDLTIDVTVGGDVTYSTETAQTYQGNLYPLKSDGGAKATATAIDPVIKNLANAQLSFLTNETTNYRYNGTTYSIVVKEYIGLQADAQMDLTDPDVEDLVVYMANEKDFNYWIDLGDGIPAYNTLSAAAAFADGDNDNIVIPFLGESFTVQSVDNNSNTLKLIKESDKATYYEGQEVTGLEGRGAYDGEEMSVKVDAVTQAGAAAITYNVRYLLLDAEGNEIDRQTLGTGVYLNENFVDSEGEYALDTVVYITDAGVESTTSKGYVTATVGKSVVDIKDNKSYPYDSTDTETSDDYWKAALTFGTDANPATATLQKVVIYNAVQNWDEDNPLYASSGTLTEAGEGATGEAFFLEGNNESDLGYGFVKFKFDGFKMDQDTTTFKLGRGACATGEGQDAGCVIYTDNQGVEREVPFYYELSLTTGPTEEGTFELDDQTFFYKCERADQNMNFAVGDFLNGVRVDMNALNSEGNVMTDYGMADINSVGKLSNIDLNGVTYAVYGTNNVLQGVQLGADGNCSFANESFDNFSNGSTTMILKSAGQTPKYFTMFYDDDNQSLDKAWGYPTLEVTNDSLSDTYKYVMYVTDESAYKKVYLLLHNSTNFTNEFTGVDVGFHGTDATCSGIGQSVTPYYTHPSCTVEDGIKDQNFYQPDLTELGFDSTDDTHAVANFGFDTNKTGADANAFIDTAFGELIDGWPSSTKGGYEYQVDFNRLTKWGLTTKDTTYKAQKTWLDYGTKVEVISTDTMGAYAKIAVPENQIYLKYALLGETTTQVAEGGTAFTGLAEGESGEEGSTKVTVDAVNYTAGACAAGGGAVADPSIFPDIVKVGQLVYLDTPKPAGSNVIVGGWTVNKLVTASTSLGEGEGTLSEALTTSGDRVVQLLANGDIVVAGYTANDTKLAAQDLIDALDALVG